MPHEAVPEVSKGKVYIYIRIYIYIRKIVRDVFEIVRDMFEHFVLRAILFAELILD